MPFDPITLIAPAAVVLWFVYRTWRNAGNSPGAAPSLPLGRTGALEETPDVPIPFGYKVSWLAVASDSPEAVAAAAGLAGLEPANWRTGLIAAYDGRVFVTPPIGGWVLLVGVGLPELDPVRRPAWNACVLGLAQKFERVCYFGTHRVVEYHAWARCDGGQLARAFAYLGERDEVLVNEGAPTAAEVELGHGWSTLAVGPRDAAEDESGATPEEDDVLDMAAAWSIDPRDLSRLAPGRSAGWVTRSAPGA